MQGDSSATQYGNIRNFAAVLEKENVTLSLRISDIFSNSLWVYKVYQILKRHQSIIESTDTHTP